MLDYLLFDAVFVVLLLASNMALIWLNIKPTWVYCVPGLPLLFCLAYVVYLLLAVVVGGLFGLFLGVAIVVSAVRCIPVLWTANRPPVEEARGEQMLRMI